MGRTAAPWKWRQQAAAAGFVLVRRKRVENRDRSRFAPCGGFLSSPAPLGPRATHNCCACHLSDTVSGPCERRLPLMGAQQRPQRGCGGSCGRAGLPGRGVLVGSSPSWPAAAAAPSLLPATPAHLPFLCTLPLQTGTMSTSGTRVTVERLGPVESLTGGCRSPPPCGALVRFPALLELWSGVALAAALVRLPLPACREGPLHEPGHRQVRPQQAAPLLVHQAGGALQPGEREGPIAWAERVACGAQDWSPHAAPCLARIQQSS